MRICGANANVLWLCWSSLWRTCIGGSGLRNAGLHRLVKHDSGGLAEARYLKQCFLRPISTPRFTSSRLSRRSTDEPYGTTASARLAVDPHEDKDLRARLSLKGGT
jgi:hypothetical protein